MAYTILRTDGSVLAVINDGNINTTTTSLSLPGAEYVGYGLALNENLVHLLENFASNTSPSSAVSQQGQLWFDKSTQTLKVFTSNNAYVPVSGTTVSATTPANNKTGDFFYNSLTAQLSIFDGSGFKIVGPGYTAQQGESGAIPVSVGDAAVVGVQHNILKLQYGNVVYATISADAAFVPSPSLSGFPNIRPGITFNSGINNITITANIIGSVTGSLIGPVIGNVTGNLTGSAVVAQNITGNLTATTVVATSITGTVTGNINSIRSAITNFSSANAQITGGRLTGITNFVASTGVINNFSTANAQITGGALQSMTSIAADIVNFNDTQSDYLVADNFSSANAIITGGEIDNLVDLTALYATIDNFSSPNVAISGGNLLDIVDLRATRGQIANFSTPNILVTGGSLTSIQTFTAATGDITFLTAANAQIAGGNIINTPIYNALITNANLVSPQAITPATNNRSNQLATTEFVHSVLPTGAIIMWGGSVASIPPGWQICDGSNSTPDLRDRFVIGAGTSYTPGDTGGNVSVTLSTNQVPLHTHALNLTGNTNTGGGHTHTTTVTDPGHRHSMGRVAGGNGGLNFQGAPGMADISPNTGTVTTGISVTVNAAASHIHSFSLTGTSEAAGGTTAVDIRPLYYALCYIQKVY
jgi:hypothetical protein